MDPARPLVLTRDQHALLGELVEIMGLVESLVIESAERADPIAAKKITTETAKQQAKLWAKALTGRIPDPRIAAQISIAAKEYEEVAEDRNAFVHALFEGVYARGYVQPGYQATTARRSKTGTTRSTSELQAIRDRAGALSCLIDQVARAIP
ncbi:hypothetical protein EI171_26065 [Bradyrhizobium sp. LCT2]|uniref:hypothetical protein n=1 Tax=Bradyrhizobium sp. LCT2 TaxID=2493093 RepID=UPI0013738B11|nr:hypothetical protein [Bradyrhizobium sp. LCT2]QHP70450.1 hypothetical protein EI171_26065 [Bradyrhizobium sp. LCT2]